MPDLLYEIQVPDLLYEIQVVASQDWPEITKYVSLVSAQSQGEELIQDPYKSEQDPYRGTKSGGMIRYSHFSPSKLINLCKVFNPRCALFP